MAREILFKAKRTDNGEWVEGLIWKKKYNTDKIFISCFPDKDDNEEVFVVDPDTICQYTGLTDKNGNKIWENDIVKGRHWAEPEIFHNFKVDWSRESGLIVFKDSPTTSASMSIHDFYDFGEAERIGNIFDNPELLEGVCEWQPGKTCDNWKPSCEPNSTYNVFGVAWFKKCPYCGKVIKIVSNGGKG